MGQAQDQSDDETERRRILDALYEVGRPFLERWKPTPEQIPKTLYHFTDAAGAIGIIDRQTLWASRARCLNDAAEVQHVIDLAAKLLSRGVTAAKQARLRKGFRKMALYYLDRRNVNPGRRIQIEAFVTCLTPTARDASHWLHYGRGGDGHALGFEASALEVARLDLLGVVYESKEQERFLSELWLAFEERFLTLAQGSDGDSRYRTAKAAAHLLADTIWAKAAWMKHPSFEREREWRLHGLHLRGLGRDLESDSRIDLPMKFRAHGNRVVPYYEVNYGKSAGPSGYRSSPSRLDRA